LSVCEKCGKQLKQMSIWLGEKETRIQKKCSCMLAEEINESSIREQMDRSGKIERIYSSSSIKEYKHMQFDNFQVLSSSHENLLRIARQYTLEFEQLRRQGKGFTICGDKGNGKTHIAAAIANLLIREQLRNVIFENVPYLMLKIRSIYSPGANASGEKEIDLINRLCSSDLLILDDIGACAWNGKDEERLYIIIDQCSTRKTPIIATTNLKSDGEMTEYLGNRAYSRLAAANVALINTCPSYRETQIKQNMTFDGDWSKFSLEGSQEEGGRKAYGYRQSTAK